MRMIAFAKYGDKAASTRQRLLQYLPFLREHGIETDVYPLLDNEHMARLVEGRSSNPFKIALAYFSRLRRLIYARRYDLIWIHYELFPFLPGGFEALVRLAGRPVIVDLDDAIFHHYDHHPNAFVRSLLGRTLERLLRSADMCVCGNDYLRDYALRFCPNAITIPTVVDTDEYVPVPRPDRAEPVIGWIGTPSTWQFVKPLLPELVPFLEARGAKFRVIGAGAEARSVPGIDAVEWQEETEIAQVQGMDIGIMPLPDRPWARGKCGYKLIQYMACGLPVVASPVGVNSDIVEHGKNGFLASGAAEWLDSLDRLLTNRGLRERMGLCGRARAEEGFSLESQKQRLLDAILSARVVRDGAA